MNFDKLLGNPISKATIAIRPNLFQVCQIFLLLYLPCYFDFLSVYFCVSLHSVAVPDIIYRLNFDKFCDTAN